jgi:hypothetical protein
MSEEKQPTLFLDGQAYDYSEATEETMKLLNDLSIIQAEVNRLQTSLSIAELAKSAVIRTIKQLEEAGESGLKRISVDETEEKTNED